MLHHLIKKPDPIAKRTPQEELVHQLTQLNDNVRKSNQQAGFIYSFWRGAIIALGATLGVTIMLTAGLWVLHRLSFIPGTDVLANTIQQFNTNQANK